MSNNDKKIIAVNFDKGNSSNSSSVSHSSSDEADTMESMYHQLIQVKVKFTDGHKLHLKVKPWCTIKDVKDQLSHIENIPTHNMRIFFRGGEVTNTWPLTLQEDKTALFCVIESNAYTSSASPQRKGSRASLEIRGTSSECAPVLVEAMRDAQKGLQLNLKPKLADDGSGGTYFLRNAHKQYVAVFKPKDEEPGAVNNPRGYVGEHGQIAAHRGIFAGQGCDRELAAYLLDHSNLAGVPPTALAEAVHPSFHQDQLHAGAHRSLGGGFGLTTSGLASGIFAVPSETSSTKTTRKSTVDQQHSTAPSPIPVKVGILQQYVHSYDVAGNLSHTMFNTEDVHRIALLDMRLLNTDRNDSNILVMRARTDSGRIDSGSKGNTSSPFKLVPIDHGYCLPQTLNIGWCDWCWMDWKSHMDQPLSNELINYIESLDAEKDSFRLKRETLIGPKSLKNMKISLMLIKIGVKAGLTLGDIANLMVRNDVDLEIPSELEVAVSRASALAESMVRSPRMRGQSYQSTSPTPPASPSKVGILMGHNEGRNSRTGSPVSATLSPTLLGAPALSVEMGGDTKTSTPSAPPLRIMSNSGLNGDFVKKESDAIVVQKEGNSLSPVKLTRRCSKRLSDRLLSFDDNSTDGGLSINVTAEQQQDTSNSDCKHASPKHIDVGDGGAVQCHASRTFQLPAAFQQYEHMDTAFGMMKSSNDENIFVLPATSPERREQRRRRRNSSDSISGKKEMPDNSKTVYGIPKKQPVGCVCSDDERFLRSPRRRSEDCSPYIPPSSPCKILSGDSSLSSSLTSSPRSGLSSPSPFYQAFEPTATQPQSLDNSFTETPESSPISSPCGTLGGARPLIRTTSFLDVRTTSKLVEINEKNVPRRILRTATYSESKDNKGVRTSSNAVNTLDRMFFSYLKKLFWDLCSLKLRQKKRSKLKKEDSKSDNKGKNVCKTQRRDDSLSPTVSISSSSSNHSTDEEENSGFYIE